MSETCVSRLRVRYAETDQMGVAWHGSYFAWFEVGRTELLRERGMTYKELERDGLHLPVIEASVRFHRPARYDDLLEVRTRVAAHSGARVSFDYEIHCQGSPGPLASGSTAHAAVDGKGRARRLPPDVRRLLG